MTDTAQAWRPSPRPRPAGGPSRPAEPPRLHVVPTPPTSEVPTSDVVEADTPQIVSAAQSGSRTVDPDVVSDLASEDRETGFRVRWAAAKLYWTPPAIFTERPPALAELGKYAKTAPWTHQSSGIVRAAGVAYYRFLGYPLTVTYRYGEWVAQRPLRFTVHLAAVRLFTLTGPGSWAVDHLIYPAAQFAGHLFL